MQSLKPHLTLAALAIVPAGSPALAQGNADAVQERPDPSSASASAQEVQSGPPPGVAGGETVFDDTWLTVGLGVSVSPSYSGSDDYVVFPVPLITGRVGGIGITPSAAGLTLDLLSQPPSGPERSTRLALGPTIRFRNDRDDRIRDDVVRAAGELDSAIELGMSGGISIPEILNRFDSLTIATAVRWDMAGAHDGMLIEPSVTYFTPVSRGTAVSISGSLNFVDDSFAEYYYSVSPQQSADSGLAQFSADGGLNSFGVNTLLAVDLDGDATNGGLGLFAIGGYSRLLGDSADTPYTSVRGSADQFFGAVGLAYTF